MIVSMNVCRKMLQMPIHWKVKPILERYKITNYRFWQDSGLARQTAYDIAEGKHRALDTRVIDKLIPYLRELTRNPKLQLGDAVEYKKGN
jgi:DNA-binding Xre family transcriptional regulator